jgi:UDP-N-acetylmuramoyl-L-alanyl-D-glutamate--2,6-diaminopimelate ligase
METRKALSELMGYLGVEVISVEQDITITGIALDSRQVQPGNLFVALRGESTDGHRYIPDAVQRGAAAIVGTDHIDESEVPYFQIEDGRAALATLSAAFWDFPARQLTVIGITGTDGKTTTANFVYNILKAADIRAGMITTVNAVIGDQQLDTGFHVTTPVAPKVQCYLAGMVSAGLTHVILEATSHGLSQQRVGNCEFDLGVVTNITHEHIDYHGSYEAYRAAKASLLISLEQTYPKQHSTPPAAIINRDDDSYEFLNRVTTVRKVSYGINFDADVKAQEINYHKGGTRFLAVGRDYEIPIDCYLAGKFNVYNCLAALAATVDGLGLHPSAVQAGIAALRGIPGRMEVIDLGQDFLAIVDFAHTPNALRRSLETAREMVSGRVIVIYGSAGLRDREKRRMMAEISTELADISVLTAEDPRTESLDSILTEMAAGAESRGGVENDTFWIMPDRGKAIRLGISLAQPGDVVIACGKGHEQSMCFGQVEYPWDDRTAMRAALAEHLNLSGPEMPYLPTQAE